MKILYLRNVEDSYQDDYLDALYALFPNAEVLVKVPEFNATPFFEVLYNLSVEDDIDYVVGSKFCGFIAYIVGIGQEVKTLLINPYIPATDYLTQIINGDQLAEPIKEYWERYNGKNENCHILLDTTTNLPEFTKVFETVKEIANVCTYCSQTPLVKSEFYSNWLKDNIK